MGYHMSQMEDVLRIPKERFAEALAAIQALASQPDTELVTVQDDENTVRIWLDSKNTAD